jgi:hypothetical protein
MTTNEAFYKKLEAMGADLDDQKGQAMSDKTQRFNDCPKHGWSALGVPCPKCKAGDAPRRCRKHGWWSSETGCPKCEKGAR